MTLSVVLITYNEEANLPRTLASVQELVREVGGEIIVVDSGSTDRTVEIAHRFGARVCVEEWKGFAAQKNSAISKASCDWVLSLDADEELSPELSRFLRFLFLEHSEHLAPWDGLWIARKNHFLDRWIRYGGFWPDLKLRLFRRDAGHLESRAVHEVVTVTGKTTRLDALRTSATLGSPGVRNHHPPALIHHSYPTLTDYIEHMNRYSSLGAEMASASRSRGFSLIDIVLRPAATFVYNYFFRLGFLDGREGLLMHLYHAAYVSWKYSKAWEISRMKT